MSAIATLFGTEKTEDLFHDAVVVAAVEKRGLIMGSAYQKGVLAWDPSLTEALARHTAEGKPASEFIGFELEFEVEPGQYVDVALTVAGKPILLLEVKSKREGQSASGWTRQMRSYSKAANVPCVLVVAHDLSEAMLAYLRIAEIDIVDLRTLNYA